MRRQRGRARKPRLTRMDAAVDAMSQLGFEERLVKKCVRQLLKEYGGDEAWPFIEDSSYRELIEAILRDDEENDRGSRVGEDGETPQDRLPLTSSAPPPEKTSQGAETASGTSNREPKNTQEVDLLNSSNPAAEPPLSNSSGIITDEGDATSWKDIVQDQAFVSTEQTNDEVRRNGKQAQVDATSWGNTVQDQTIVCTEQPYEAANRNGKESKTPELADDTVRQSGDDPNKIEAVHQVRRHISFSPSPTVNTPVVRRRFPCYGWIEDDDDEDSPDDFLPSKPGIESKTSCLLTTVDKRKTTRRLPCNGWIEGNGDSPIDSVQPKPTMESKTTSSLSQTVDKRKTKRHYGWIEEDGHSPN